MGIQSVYDRMGKGPKLLTETTGRAFVAVVGRQPYGPHRRRCRG